MNRIHIDTHIRKDVNQNERKVKKKITVTSMKWRRLSHGKQIANIIILLLKQKQTL